MKQWMRAAWRRFAGLGRVGRLAAAVYGGAMALMVAWAVWAWEDTDPAKPVDELTYLVCLLFAVGCTVVAARVSQGRRRYGWLALAVALTAWAVGEVAGGLPDGAERAGLMRQVANCVVNLALGQVRAWHCGGVAMTVAVNLSMVNFSTSTWSTRSTGC